MSERNRNQKRRDKKGRILRNGESQRADGRYAFVYTDCFGNQKSALKFYGSSFITDGAGEVIQSMDRDSEGVITAEFDLDELERERFSWGLFRDRRPEIYHE